MAYKIIGVHGLANKPEEITLKGWWQNSILEGLKRNCGNTEQKLNFEIVYWADIDYPVPVPDSKNPEPYTAAGAGQLKMYKDGWRDEVVLGALSIGSKPLDWAKRYLGVGKVADAVLAAKLQDLSKYYKNATKGKEMCDRVRAKLLDNSGQRIMLIAHSMGSIIAYDVLREIGRTQPQVRVDHFVTIGSPLGLPHVKDKIWRENHLVRTPSVVSKWTNFVDRRDPVALDVHLSDDYEENVAGVRVRDDLVINGYTGKKKDGKDGKPNHHKSYGYLRAPEMSNAIRAFL